MVVILVLLTVLSAILLRINNLNMVEYRDAVIAADETLDRKKVEDSAESLKLFVAAHMNTDTGQIPLQNLYNQAVGEAFSKVNDVDSTIYAQATEECKSVLAQRGYSGYSACVADNVGTSESNFNQPDLPNPALYYLSFASPAWSFDPAGVTVAATIVVFSAIVLKSLTEVVLGAIASYRGKY